MKFVNSHSFLGSHLLAEGLFFVNFIVVVFCTLECVVVCSNKDVGLMVLGTRFFSSEYADQCWAPPSLLFFVYWGSFLGVKQARCDDEYTCSSSVEVKNEWSYTCVPVACPNHMDKHIFYVYQHMNNG